MTILKKVFTIKICVLLEGRTGDCEIPTSSVAVTTTTTKDQTTISLSESCSEGKLGNTYICMLEIFEYGI